jgi:hypothetical protein
MASGIGFCALILIPYKWLSKRFASLLASLVGIMRLIFYSPAYVLNFTHIVCKRVSVRFLFPSRLSRGMTHGEMVDPQRGQPNIHMSWFF